MIDKNLELMALATALGASAGLSPSFTRHRRGGSRRTKKQAGTKYARHTPTILQDCGHSNWEQGKNGCWRCSKTGMQMSMKKFLEQPV